MLQSASLHPEIKYRMATVASSLNPLTNRLLKRDVLPRPTRAKYAQAYLCSKGLFNSATWPALTISDHKSLLVGIMKIFKRILAPKIGIYLIWIFKTN